MSFKIKIGTAGNIDNGVLKSLIKLKKLGLDGQEVEFGITSKKWTAMPVDEGTKKVISDGASILIDKSGALKRIL